MNSRSSSTVRPTTTSTRLVMGISVLCIGLLLWAVPAIIEPVLLGVVGVTCLTGSLWLVGHGTDTSRTTFVVASLIVPASVGIVGGTVIAALLVMSRVFPVSTSNLVSVGSLIVIGNVGVFLGCILTVLGVSLGYGNVVDRQTLDTFINIGVLTGLVPMTVTILYVLRAFLTESGAAGATPDVHLSVAVSVLLSTGGNGLHLSDFLLSVTLAAGTATVALRLLPAGELIGDTGSAETTDPRLTKLFYTLGGLAVIAGFVGIMVVPFEIALSPAEIRATLGGFLFSLIRSVTTAGLLRLLLFSLTVASVTAACVGVLFQRSVRDREEPTLAVAQTQPDRVGPLVVGGLLTLGAIAVSGPAFDIVVDWTARQLPAPVATEMRDLTSQAGAVYGEATFTVLLGTMLVAAILGFVVLVRIAIAIGYLSPETTGYSLASAGLFVGVSFGATIDIPSWLVFGGIIASLLVWDLGRFGIVLGREIGTATTTRSTELVHAGATLLVGVAGAALAAGLASQLQTGLVSPFPVSTVALLALVVGLLSLATALR